MELANYTRMNFDQGLELVTKKQYMSALLFFLEKLAQDPIIADELVINENIGFCQLKLKKYNDAKPYFERMNRLDPKSRAEYYLGELYWTQELYENAIHHYECAMNIKEQSHLKVFILKRLMYCYYFIENFDLSEQKASEVLLNAKNDKQELAEYWNHAGNIYSARLEFEKAINCYKKVLEIDKTNVIMHQNIANANFLMRNFGKAEYHHKKLLKTPELESPAMFNLAQIYLAQEDYKKGWKAYESRFVNTLPKKMKDEMDKMLKHTNMWKGESLKNKSLLIIAEQGFGDTLQFSRFISLIKKDNTRIVFVVQPGLERILKNVEGIDELVITDIGTSPSPTSIGTKEKFDYCTILMSLPYLLGINSKDKVPNKPHLVIDDADKEVWRQKVGSGLKVGLIFAGERSMFFNKWLIDKRRSMNVTNFERELRIPGTEWYNLTYHKNRPDLEEQVFHCNHLIDLTHEINDFYDTACLMANMDLVVGVDTAAIHLAGGLGKETVLLNRFDSCWRWGNVGERTVWYPNMTVLRQPEFMNWQPCLDRLHMILKSKI